MMSEHSELLKRLEAWSPDVAGAAFSFSKRLARDNAWTLTYAQRVTHEYKRFAFLAVTAGHPVTPSDQVDQAWHLHLLYTHSYWKEFCPGVLRTPLHHGPTKGGAVERSKFSDWYARTLASYRAFFGEEPPSDIWPAPEQRFGEDIHFARVNTVRNWVVPKPVWMRKTALALFGVRQRLSRSGDSMTRNGLRRPGAAALFTMFVLSGCTGDRDFLTDPSWPFDLSGGPFLIFFLLTWAATAGSAAWLRRVARAAAGDPAVPLPSLDAYDTAFLTGGPNRALFAAVANLTHRGALEIDEKKHRLRREVLPDSMHPFEASILRNIPVRPGSTFKEISDQLSTLPESQWIEDKLKRLGLLTTERWNVCFIPMLLALIPPAIGSLKIGIGISGAKPVEILVVLSLISLAVALAFAIRPHRTRRGDVVLAGLHEQYRGLETQTQPGDSSLALVALPLAVGLFGPSVLAGTGLDDLEKKLQANTGGSQGGGCGAGCGGGGCGGGCGGCGG